MTRTEYELIARSAAGDLAAFDVLALRHADVLYRYVVRVAGPERAERLCEQTLIRLHASLKRRDPHAPVLPDLLAIAVELLRAEAVPAPDAHPEILSLCADAGLSVEQAAAILGITPEAAQARLADALSERAPGQPQEEAITGLAETLRAEGKAPGSVGYRVHMMLEHPLAAPRRVRLPRLRLPRLRLASRYAGLAVLLLLALLAVLAGRAYLRRASGVPDWLNEDRGRQVMVVTLARQPATDSTRRALRVGDRLPKRTRLRTGEGGRLDLVTRGGAQLVLNERSEIEWGDDAREVTLLRGEVFCQGREDDLRWVRTQATRLDTRNAAVDIAIMGPRVSLTVLAGRARVPDMPRSRGEIKPGERLVLGVAPTRVEKLGALPPRPNWCRSEGEVAAADSRIIYLVSQPMPIGDGREALQTTDVWAMALDGIHRQRLFTLLGSGRIESGARLHARPGGGLTSPLARQAVLNTYPAAFPSSRIGGTFGMSGGLQQESLLQRLGVSRRVEMGYAPQVSSRLWLLNAAAGEWAPLNPLSDDTIASVHLSPRGRYALVTAMPPFEPLELMRLRMPGANAWSLDLETGRMRRLDAIGAEANPGRVPKHVVIETVASVWPAGRPLLNLLDLETAERRALGPAGNEPTLSPDGTRLAYITTESRITGTPGEDARDPVTSTTTSSLWVRATSPSSAARCVLRRQNTTLQRPTWSPDGRQIACMLSSAGGQSLVIVTSDGSAVRPIYRAHAALSYLPQLEWSPSGDAVYAFPLPDSGSQSWQPSVLRIAADGTGEATELGGNAADSPRSPEEQEALRAAVLDVAAGLRLFSRGERLARQVKVDHSRAAFEAAARVFSGVVWRHPRAGLLHSDLLGYADAAAARAKDPCSSVLRAQCAMNIVDLQYAFVSYLAAHKRLPSRLDELEAVVPTGSDRTEGRVTGSFRCRTPQGDEMPYDYLPPKAGRYRVGDTIFRCRLHPEMRVVWGPELFAHADSRGGIGGREMLRSFGEVTSSPPSFRGMGSAVPLPPMLPGAPPR